MSHPPAQHTPDPPAQDMPDPPAQDMPDPPAQSQPYPGREDRMQPPADHGENSYRGSGRLAGKAAVITGGDSGIGRAVAIAFAREGADVLISYLNEDDDAAETAPTGRGRRAAGACWCPATSPTRAHCRAIVDRAVEEFGRIDVLVNNAAFQMSHETHRGHPRRRVATAPSTSTSPPCSACARRPCRTWSRAPRSSTPRRSTPTSPGRTLLPYAATKGGHRQLHRRPGADARRAGHPGQLRGAGADLDAADPLDHAAGAGRGVRQRTPRSGGPGSPPRSRRPTCCSPRTRPATSPAPRSRSPAGSPSCDRRGRRCNLPRPWCVGPVSAARPEEAPCAPPDAAPSPRRRCWPCSSPAASPTATIPSRS